MADLRESSVCDDDNSHPPSSLPTVLYQLKQSGIFCDVVMKVCGTEIYAHSNVLAACSPYFSSFFAQDLPRQFSQRSPQVIEIQIDGAGANSMYEEAVASVVEYMYTGDLTINEHNVAQINEIGRIMQIISVGQRCDLFLSGLLMFDSERKQVLRKKAVSQAPRLKANKFLSMTSVATQVVPKFLGIRADVCDAAVNTDKKFTSPWAKLPSGKPRGRPRKTLKEPEDEAEEITQDVLSQALEEVREIEEGHPMIVDQDPGGEEDTGVLDDTGVEDADIVEGDEQGETSCVTLIRRSLRRAKPKKFVDYEEIEFVPRKKIKVESGDYAEVDEAEKQGDACQTLFDLAAAAEELQKETSEQMEEEDAEIADNSFKSDDNIVAESCEEAALVQSPEKKKKVKPKIKVEREYKQKPEGKFQCDRCTFATNSVKLYGGHAKQHKMDNNQCYYCDAGFEDQENLTKHMATHTGPERFLCRFCDRTFKVRTQLNIHLPKHFTVKPFICEICSMGFKWKHALTAHMVVHSNRKDQVCDICGYATAHKNQLTSHKRIHTGETLKCVFPGCDYQALKTQNMKYHLMTHSGDKPHQCEVCGQAFTLKKNLKRHMLLHNDGDKQGCHECDFSTPRIDKLKEHLLRSHGIGTPPERRVRITDLVADSENQRVMSANKLPVASTAATQEAALVSEDQKPIERYIIEIETDGTKQQLEISPSQIMVDSSGNEHVLSAHGITDLGTLEISGTCMEYTTSQGVIPVTEEVLGEPGEEQYEGVHYTEVMEEAIPELVEHVTTQYEDEGS